MKRRTPIGSRKWKEISDFDLKVLSVIIIFLSLSTVTLLIYAFYLKIQKSQVDVVIREIIPEQNVVVQKSTKSATETLIIMQQIEEKIPLEDAEKESTSITQEVLNQTKPVLMEATSNFQENTNRTISSISAIQQEKIENSTNESTNTQIEEIKKEENKYLKDLTKFDYNLLVSRMAENLPSSVLNSLYLYTVDGGNALKIAKSTQSYVIDKLDNSKYCLLTLNNIMPELNPARNVYTVMTDPVKESKEAFKSVVNFRTLGISSFSISTSSGYVICLGLFTSESKARNFYYSQDWVELTKYGRIKGAKVVKIGK